MSLTSGATIGPYRVDRQLGRGGMGVVFLAHDTRLGRMVALKSLPEEVASDPDRLQRFEREARVLASLSHPNVAAIYGLEESEGRRYLALEHIEGETLAKRLSRGPLSIAETIDLGIQIAAGMEAAHDGGIVHRDLKPANIMITPDDHVKVLDFGLAKGRVVTDESGPAKSPGMLDSPALSSPTLSSPTLPHSPTLHSPGTMPGVILGTAAYLSPEQARGKAVDRRTDIWSFGCVLYECLTGERAFAGETVSDTIAKILEREMDWGPLPKGTPPRLMELLERCLTKDPKRRLRDMGDARITLEEIRAGKAPGTTPAVDHAVPAPARRTLALVAGSALVFGAVLGTALWNSLRPEPPRKPMHVAIPLPKGLTIRGAMTSPDGQLLAIVGFLQGNGGETSRPRIYLRSMQKGTWDPVPGTEGAAGIFMSHDGRWIAFIAAPPSGGQPRLYKVPSDLSSPPAAICAFDPTWNPVGAWLSNGDFIVTTSDGSRNVRISADGEVEQHRFDFPGFDVRLNVIGSPLPGDRGVLMNAIWYERNIFMQGIAVMDLKSGKTKMLVRDGGNPQYSPLGWLLFTRQTTLFAAPFDVARLKITGEPVALLGPLRSLQLGNHSPFGFNASGILLYVAGPPSGADRRILVADRAGKTTDWSSGEAAWDYFIKASSDGHRVLGAINNPDMITELWISERGRASPYRVPTPPGADCVGIALSPDGKQVAYSSLSQSARDGIYVSPVDGTEPPRRLMARTPDDPNLIPSSWSPDGILLLNRVEGRKVTLMSLAAQPAEGARVTPKPLFSDDANRGPGAFSPDGDLIAYESTETGSPEIFVCAWNGQALMGLPILISSGGGTMPRWGTTGNTLYYKGTDNKLREVRILPGSDLRASPPTVVWDLGALEVANGLGRSVMCDLLPDGGLVFVRRSELENEVTDIDVVLNFDQELKAKMRAARK